MLNPQWKPADMQAIEDKWADVKLPVNENISAAQAERLMTTYLQIRDDWADQYVNALYYEDKCEFKYKAAYNLVFTTTGASEEKKPSDRTKDIAAQSSGNVKLAALNLMEAKAYTVAAKLKLEGATLAHHNCKKIMDKASEEKYL
jgi:hypothetical protein